MKISVITAVKDGAALLGRCLDSVAGQRSTGVCVEHIVVDGESSDGSHALASDRLSGDDILLRGPDSGIYQALNRGLKTASGDLIGVLGSDDVYRDRQVLGDVACLAQRTPCVGVYGDLVYENARGQRVRTWQAGALRPALVAWGWMPPHPALFLKRTVYAQLGSYREDLRIAADYELMLRLIRKPGVQLAYLPRELVRMRSGGLSNRNLAAIAHKMREDHGVMRAHGLPLPALALLCKSAMKLPQLHLNTLWPRGAKDGA